MGFGLIFCGYLSLFFLRTFPAELLGFFIVYLGLDKLSIYNKHFRRAKVLSVVMFFYTLLQTTLVILDYTGIFKISAKLSAADNVLYYLILALFHFFLYRAIFSISEYVGYSKGKVRTKSCAFFGILFIALLVTDTFFVNSSGYLKLSLLVLQILFYILNAYMLYACYAMIVTDEVLQKEAEKEAKYLKAHPPKQTKKSNATTYRIKK